MKKLLSFCIFASVLLSACASKTTPGSTYEFLPRPTPGIISQVDEDITVNFTDSNEWVIVAGTGAVLSPPTSILGAWGKCFVVGISGPTDKIYTITNGFLGLGGWYYVEETSMDHRHQTLAQAMEDWQDFWVNESFCAGLDVWTISK